MHGWVVVIQSLGLYLLKSTFDVLVKTRRLYDISLRVRR